MLAKVRPLKIRTNPKNEVTSDRIFASRVIKNKKNGNYQFDDSGIFSDRIFGQFGKCKCGNQSYPGICPKCGTRVLDRKYIPNFYISFPLDIPYLFIEKPKACSQRDAEKLLNYQAFLYEDELIDFNLRELDLTQYDQSKVLIGKEALYYLGVSNEWYYNQVHDKVSVPHTSYRRIIQNGDEFHLGEINSLLIDILKAKKKLLNFKDYDNDIFHKLAINNKLLEAINTYREAIFALLTKGKESFVAREFRGQTVTGAIRGVLTNNYSLDESIIKIGSYFIPYLYPMLYKEFTKDGVTDILSLNLEILKRGYFVLINRQPSIGAKSFLAMLPVFSELKEEQYVLQVNPIIVDGMAADFDGDTINVLALYTEEANQAAQAILAHSNYIEGSNQSIRNAIPKSFLYAED